MFCERYEHPLKDAAAGGQLAVKLLDHLAACSSCRVAFAEEQSLYAAIDSTLHAVANTEAPATLIPRVHVALNNEPVLQRRSLNLAFWGFAGCVVTAALICAFLYLPAKHSSSPVASVRPVPVVTTRNSSGQPPLNPAHADGVSSVQHKRPLAASGSSGSNWPEVLVADEERVAFAKFIVNALPSAANIPAKSIAVPRAPEESVEISPVEIASLEARPLDRKDTRQGQF